MTGDEETSDVIGLGIKSQTRQDLVERIGPLWGEKDEAKRIQGWKDVDKYIAEQGYVLPLLQYYQPILYKSDLKVTPNVSGALQPATLISKA